MTNEGSPENGSVIRFWTPFERLLIEAKGEKWMRAKEAEWTLRAKLRNNTEAKGFLMFKEQERIKAAIESMSLHPDKAAWPTTLLVHEVLSSNSFKILDNPTIEKSEADRKEIQAAISLFVNQEKSDATNAIPETVAKLRKNKTREELQIFDKASQEILTDLSSEFLNSGNIESFQTLFKNANPRIALDTLILPDDVSDRNRVKEHIMPYVSFLLAHAFLEYAKSDTVQKNQETKEWLSATIIFLKRIGFDESSIEGFIKTQEVFDIYAYELLKQIDHNPNTVRTVQLKELIQTLGKLGIIKEQYIDIGPSLGQKADNCARDAFVKWLNNKYSFEEMQLAWDQLTQLGFITPLRLSGLLKEKEFIVSTYRKAFAPGQERLKNIPLILAQLEILAEKGFLYPKDYYRFIPSHLLPRAKIIPFPDHRQRK